MGTVTSIAVNPFGATFSRSPLHVGLAANTRGATPNRPQSNRIVIGFKSAALGLAPAGSASYRTMTTARSAGARLNDRVGALAARHGFRRTEVSPAILAARLTLDDTARIASVMDALRGEADVAYVEREATLTIRDAPPARLAKAAAFANARTWETASSPPSKSAAATLIPNDRFYPYEMWAANMVDLPKAWAVTTGSSNVTVAVLDMGVRFDHPSIAPNLTTDGYDFVNGFDFDSTNVNCDDGKPFSFNTTAGDGDGPDADPTDIDDIAFDYVRQLLVPRVGGRSRAVDVGNHRGHRQSEHRRRRRELDGEDPADARPRHHRLRILLRHRAGTALRGRASRARAPTARWCRRRAAPIVNISLGGGFDDPVMRDAVTAAVERRIADRRVGGQQRIGRANSDVSGRLSGSDGRSRRRDGRRARHVHERGHVHLSLGSRRRLPSRRQRRRRRHRSGLGFRVRRSRSSSSATARPRRRRSSRALPRCCSHRRPSLTAAQLRSRIEQFATRPAGSSRSDTFGWGIVNAYNSLTQTTGPARQASARLIDATTGAVARTTHGERRRQLRVRQAHRRIATTCRRARTKRRRIDRRARTALRRGRRTRNATVFNVERRRTVGCPRARPALRVRAERRRRSTPICSRSEATSSEPITTPDVHDIYRVTIPAAGHLHVRNLGTRRIVRTRHRARHVLDRERPRQAWRSGRATTSIRCRVRSAHAYRAQLTPGHLLRHRRRELGQFPHSPRRTAAIACRFAPATSGRGLGESRRTAAAKHATAVSTSGLRLRAQILLEPALHLAPPQLLILRLEIQCPSSGKITSRLGTFIRWSDVNIDRSSVYGTR